MQKWTAGQARAQRDEARVQWEWVYADSLHSRELGIGTENLPVLQSSTRLSIERRAPCGPPLALIFSTKRFQLRRAP